VSQTVERMCVCVSRTVELPQGLLVRDGGAAAERSLGRVQHLSRLPHVSPGLSLCGERRLALCAQREPRQDKARTRIGVRSSKTRRKRVKSSRIRASPPCCLLTASSSLLALWRFLLRLLPLLAASRVLPACHMRRRIRVI
jgi:hypothetical protein